MPETDLTMHHHDLEEGDWLESVALIFERIQVLNTEKDIVFLHVKHKPSCLFDW